MRTGAVKYLAFVNPQRDARKRARALFQSRQRVKLDLTVVSQLI
jgi:hypothetical protein